MKESEFKAKYQQTNKHAKKKIKRNEYNHNK